MHRGDFSSVAVIGAGLAGLSCAGRLAGAGCRVTVLEKSGDIGGRLATRRRADVSWNHGAPAVEARAGLFTEFLRGLARAGSAAFEGDSGRNVTGRPDMRELLRPVARELETRFALEITRLARDGAGWWLHARADTQPIGPFHAVVLTMPAPQAMALLEVSGVVAPEALGGVRMAPGWALLLASPQPLDFLHALHGNGTVDRVVAGECGRLFTWVIHASAAWSRPRLEWSRDALALEFFLTLGDLAGRALPAPDHLAAHRWRYGRVERPLGQRCLWLPEQGLGFAGDWCPGGDAEGAFVSGEALAAQMLAGA